MTCVVLVGLAHTDGPAHALARVRARTLAAMQISVWRVGCAPLRNEPCSYAKTPGLFACVCQSMAPAVQDLLQAATANVWG